MPYTVNFTDKENKTPITVFDNTSSTDTSLTFPGRNVTGYGQIIAENFLALLENFASADEPTFGRFSPPLQPAIFVKRMGQRTTAKQTKQRNTHTHKSPGLKKKQCWHSNGKYFISGQKTVRH